jgi:hypothetical protein
MYFHRKKDDGIIFHSKIDNWHDRWVYGFYYRHYLYPVTGLG